MSHTENISTITQDPNPGIAMELGSDLSEFWLARLHEIERRSLLARNNETKKISETRDEIA